MFASDDIKIMAVIPDLAEGIAARFKEFFAKSLKVSGWQRDDLFEAIRLTTVQFWIVFVDDKPAGLFFTQMRPSLEEPVTGTALFGFGLSGHSVRRWGCCIVPALKPFASGQGCCSIEFAGRRGWLKFGPEFQVLGSRSDHPREYFFQTVL